MVSNDGYAHPTSFPHRCIGADWPESHVCDSSTGGRDGGEECKVRDQIRTSPDSQKWRRLWRYPAVLRH